MTFLGLVITLVVVGVVLYLVNAIIPMQPQIKKILNIVVVVVFGVVALVWLLGFFGINVNQHVRMPR